MIQGGMGPQTSLLPPGRCYLMVQLQCIPILDSLLINTQKTTQDNVLNCVKRLRGHVALCASLGACACMLPGCWLCIHSVQPRHCITGLAGVIVSTQHSVRKPFSNRLQPTERPCPMSTRTDIVCCQRLLIDHDTAASFQTSWHVKVSMCNACTRAFKPLPSSSNCCWQNLTPLYPRPSRCRTHQEGVSAAEEL